MTAVPGFITWLAAAVCESVGLLRRIRRNATDDVITPFAAPTAARRWGRRGLAGSTNGKGNRNHG